MTANVFGFWNIMLGLVIALPTGFVLCFIAYLIHRDSQNAVVTLRLPRLLPWTAASRARGVRAETELEEARTALFQARHSRLQKQLVYDDLEEARLKKALEPGPER